MALYRAIITRVSAGEAYYPAAHDEMLSRHYGLRSVFNWRTPTLTRLIASFPSPGYARGILLLIAAGTLVVAIQFMKEQGGLTIACVAAVWLLGGLLPAALGDTFLFFELWAGILIALSILVYSQLPIVSVITAVAAMFIRELAVPYVVLLAIVLVCDLRTMSSPRTFRILPPLLLLIGLGSYALFFPWHASQVQQHLLTTDPAYPTGWIQFGGLPFLLATARQNLWLLALPVWVMALYLPIAIIGLFAWPWPSARLARPACLGYLTLFAIAGKPFNDYWGLLISPTLCIAFCFGLRALPDVIRSAFDGTGRQARDEVLLQ